MKNLKPKSPSESKVEMNDIVLNSHANALGTLFGGVLIGWIDICAAICSQRHSNKICVTASMDTIHFLAPIKVGDMVTLHGKVVFTGKTSMTVAVDVTAENPLEGEKRHCVTAYLTFVALDSQNKPTAVPPLMVKSPEEKAAFEAAKKRRTAVLNERKKT